MNKGYRWAITLCVLPALLLMIGCGGGGGGGGSAMGTLSLALTDNPGDYESVFIKVVEINVVIEGSGHIPLDFADFSSPAIVEVTPDSVTVDLIRLSEEEPIAFAFGSLPVGKINQIRFVVSEASLIAFEDVVGIDGPDPGDDITHVEAEYPVKVPSGSQSGIKLNPRDVRIFGGGNTSITLDFDADKSIVKLGAADKKNRKYDFILKPVIFILEAIGTVRIDTETMAVGLNFPTAAHAVETPGGGVIGDGDVLVANAGTAGLNSHSVLNIDISSVIPVDASDPADLNWSLFASSADVQGGEPLVNSPSGLSQHSSHVWTSNAASVVGGAGTGNVSEIDTNGVFTDLFIANDPPTESEFGLRLTSGVEFGGFAPNGSLSGDDLVIFQTNGDGSITGISLVGGAIFDVLPAGSFIEPTDLAFVPEAFGAGDPVDTPIGTLYVTDATSETVTKVALRTTGQVGDAATRIAAGIVDTFSFAFASKPAGIAYSAGSNRLYIGNRGNGTIIAARPDGIEIMTYETGMGADTISGIDVVAGVGQDTIFFTNTAGNDDPSNDEPGVGASSLERAVVSY
jgi:hypothetical protein